MPAGDGKCVICDSYVRPATLVRICDECNYGSYAGRCTICGGIGISDAYYCKECTLQEKDVSQWLCCEFAPFTFPAINSFLLLRCRGMVVQRLSILDQQRPICFMNGKSMGLRSDDS